MQLRTVFKNELFQVLTRSKIDFNEFEYETKDRVHRMSNQADVRINLKNTDSYFGIVFNSGLYNIHYQPDRIKTREAKINIYWTGVIKFFKIWVKSVEVDYETEDQWEKARNLQSKINFSDQNNFTNENFSIEEFQLLEGKLNELSRRISSLKLDKVQIDEVHEHTKQLLEFAKKSKKRQWYTLFQTTVVTIAYDIISDPSKQSAFIELVKVWLGNYYISQ